MRQVAKLQQACSLRCQWWGVALLMFEGGAMPGYDVINGLSGWSPLAYVAGLALLLLVGWLIDRARKK